MADRIYRNLASSGTLEVTSVQPLLFLFHANVGFYHSVPQHPASVALDQ